MRYGAVIVAAGMSTRMNQFKQLMQVGGESFAERVVNNFLHAGVDEVVMVTGYQAEKVEEALVHLPITFLRNNRYEKTQMFDSAKIGLEYLNGKVDRVFFCPVDIPFFLEDTVRLEMSREEDLVYPICHNRIGHPILFSARVIPSIVNYDGPMGLKGALDSLYTQMTCFLPVDDEGTVMDADTREDFQYLLDMQNSTLLHADVDLVLSTSQRFFNSELRELLRQIDIEKSVRKASELAGISYSKAWNLIRHAEKQLGYRIITRQAGGKNGGSAGLSERGKHLVDLYDTLELRMKHLVEREFCSLFSSSEIFPQSSREGNRKIV